MITAAISGDSGALLKNEPFLRSQQDALSRVLSMR